MSIELVQSKKQVDDIVDYIGVDYKKTPYLYVNVIKYGVGSENCQCWIDNVDGAIQGVYFKYFDCLHFFSRESQKYSVDKFMDIQKGIVKKVIMTTSDFGERIEELFDNEYFYVEKNNVIDMDGIKPVVNDFRSCLATSKDVPEIVDLLLSDKEYTEMYSREILLKQMQERFSDDFSRYFVVKMDDKIVASCSTYGEVPGFALIGSVIVHPEYRRRGLASDVENFACYLLETEGISRVGFVNYNNEASLALHEKLGAKKTSTLYKFVKKDI